MLHSSEIKPFVKWAGGKSQILKEIRAAYPDKLGRTIKKYAEPFVGGGAVLFDVLKNFDIKQAYISDINRELILLYIKIRDNYSELSEYLKAYENEYLSAEEDIRKEIFYKNRDRFNLLKSEKSEQTELAALFLFLNRTCFNGLYRINSRGEFNVPYGKYINPRIFNEKNLIAVSEKLQKVEIVCADYKESRKFIDGSTFAYFDPPYRPLTKSSNFTSYTQEGFNDKEQAELAGFIDMLGESGAYIIASNSDPKNSDMNDNFFDELYSKHKIRRIAANRMINSVASGRGKISELLIVSY